MAKPFCFCFFFLPKNLTYFEMAVRENFFSRCNNYILEKQWCFLFTKNVDLAFFRGIYLLFWSNSKISSIIGRMLKLCQIDLYNRINFEIKSTVTSYGLFLCFSETLLLTSTVNRIGSLVGYIHELFINVSFLRRSSVNARNVQPAPGTAEKSQRLAPRSEEPPPFVSSSSSFC